MALVRPLPSHQTGRASERTERCTARPRQALQDSLIGLPGMGSAGIAQA